MSRKHLQDKTFNVLNVLCAYFMKTASFNPHKNTMKPTKLFSLFADEKTEAFSSFNLLAVP